MIFASPIWLIALAPWGALSAWLLSGRLQKRGVPFLRLWPADVPDAPKPKRAWKKPPLALLAILLAMLLGIIATAGPNIPHRRSVALTVIVDRGIGSDFAQSAKELDTLLRKNDPDAEVGLRIVPDTVSISGGDWLSKVMSLQPTAAQDGDALVLACRKAIGESGGPVILLSNRDIELNDPRLVRFTSSALITNVGIDLLSVRASPHAQAMVRLFNQSKLGDAELVLRADGKIVQSEHIALPPEGEKRNYFVDFSGVAKVVEAEVRCDDSIKINHRAWVVRRAAWPVVEAAGPLPAELTRMIEVYGRHRVGSDASIHVDVVAAQDSIPVNAPVAIVAGSSAGATKLTDVGPLMISNDLPGIESLDWPHILAGATVSAAPGAGWRAAISAPGQVIVATRDSPVRQAWIGFHADDFARRPDFVVFWSAIFDWLGGGGSLEYASDEVGPLSGNWELQEPAGLKLSASDTGLVPGLYASADGSMRAINASSSLIRPFSSPDVLGRLNAIARADERKTPLAGAALLTAFGLLGLSAATWRAIPRAANLDEHPPRP